MKTTHPKNRETNTNKIKGSPNGDTLDGDFIENLKISNDPTYGYSPNNPIKVANSKNPTGDSVLYLKSLRGPNNEIIEYYRSGSFSHCTDDPSKPNILLDRYILNHENNDDDIIIFINIYDSSEMMVPFGLIARK